MWFKQEKMVKEKQLTVEQKIVKYLSENGQKMNWLAKKIGVSSGHLHAVLKGENNVKRELTQSNLQKINTALNTDFTTK